MRWSGCCWYFFFFKQKTAYEMRISDWSSDVCSSDLVVETVEARMLRRLGEADRRTRPDLADRAPIISRIADLLIAIGITRANLDVLEERAVVEIILGVRGTTIRCRRCARCDPSPHARTRNWEIGRAHV